MIPKELEKAKLTEIVAKQLALLRGLAWSLLPELRREEFRKQADTVIPLINRRRNKAEL